MRMNKDSCDMCDKEFPEKELFCIEDWTIYRKRRSMDTSPYMVAAFSWACKECLDTKTIGE